MPYIMVDEVPDGAVEVDVVPRADYEAIVQERDATIQQRDDALTQIEDARKEVRDAKALYADAILNANRKREVQEPHKDESAKPTMATSVSQLFE